MTSGTMPDRGELLLIPFPFTDLSAAKRRPVLAITAADGYGDFIALPVTSRPQTAHAIALSSADLVGGSLPALSWIRTNRVVTLNGASIVRSVGRAADSVVTAAVAQLCAYLTAS